MSYPDISNSIFGKIMSPSLTSQQALLNEKKQLVRLRQAVTKGAIQAEHGEFSEHTVQTLLKELNRKNRIIQTRATPT